MDMVICDHSDKCEIRGTCPHSKPHKRHKLDNFYDPCGKRFCNIGPGIGHFIPMAITKCILVEEDYKSIWG